MEVRLLFEDEIRRLIGPKEAIPAVREAFVKLSKKEAVLPNVINLDIPEFRTEVHVKGAYLRGTPYYAIKEASGSWDNPAQGLPTGTGHFSVSDAKTGFLKALLFDGGYLTNLRTGAAGGVAADLLANKDADRVGIVGTGGQARHQLASLLQVRRPSRIYAWSPNAAHVGAFIQDMETTLGVRVAAAKSLEHAVDGSDVLATVTPATKPIVRAEWVSPGTHITAVGSDSPEKHELEVGVLRKASKVVADHLEQCARLGEIHHAIDAGVLRRESVYAELGDIAAGLKPGRESEDEITVADLTGVGVQDAAVANLVVAEAERRGLGKILEM